MTCAIGRKISTRSTWSANFYSTFPFLLTVKEDQLLYCSTFHFSLTLYKWLYT